MEKKCQEDDNVSSTDQVGHNLASSVSGDKTSKQNSGDADVSTVSSERGLSANHTFIRSDVSSGIGQTLNEKRKNSSTITAEEISRGDSTTIVLNPHKQLKADSSSSKNSGAMAQLSSVDSVDPKPAHSLNNREYSHPTQSVDSKKVFQGPEYSMTTKSDFEFDLNEGMEANEANWYPKSIYESNYSGSSDVLSEPIPVVAKVGVPMGSPTKPLQFGGERGWKRSGITSAFSSTHHKNPAIEKSPVYRGFDLNIPATIDPELPADEAAVYVSPKMPEGFNFNGQKGNENYSGPGKMGIDLNYNPNIEEACTSIYPRGETRQFLRNCDAIGTVMRPPYWVDLSSVQGYGHVQGQPFVLGAPSTEQVQMVIPIQLPNAPPGFYIGNINNLTPALYPARAPSPLLNQPGPPVYAAYSGNAQLLENSHGMNPHAFANMRQTVLSNGSIAFVENGSKAGNPAEILTPLRNHLFDGRMKPTEQVTFPISSMKRSEPDTGWGSSQINYR